MFKTIIGKLGYERKLQAVSKCDTLIKNKYTLRVRTAKGGGAFIVTTISCHVEDERGFETFEVFKDLYMTIEQTACNKVTAKAVETQHMRVLENEAELIRIAEAHYSKE